MIPLKNIFRNSLLIFSILTVTVGHLSAQEILYYSVEKNYQFSISQMTGDYGNYKKEESASEENKKDTLFSQINFLIPFIISQVKAYTYYTVLPIEQREGRPLNLELNIAINIFNNNLEYQLKIYRDSVSTVSEIKNDSVAGESVKKPATKKSAKAKKPVKTEKSLFRTADFFINPDNPDYQNIIKTEIQRLFNSPLSGRNEAPVAKIRIDGELVTDKTRTFYRSHRDTVFLDGTSSTDDNTPKKYFEYSWKVTKYGQPNAFLADFNIESSHQKLVISDPGRYEFSLVVSDGVAASKPDIVCVEIDVLTKPFLTIHQKSFDRISQRNLFLKSENKIFKEKDNIGFDVPDKNRKSQLVFFYLYSHDKTRKFFIDKSTYKKDSARFSKEIENTPEKIISMLDSLLSLESEKIIKLDTKRRQLKKEGSMSGALHSLKQSLNIERKKVDSLQSLLNEEYRKLDSVENNKAVSMPGILLYKSRFDDAVGSLKFWLNDSIKPGIHKYLIYTDYEKVTSNFDTVTISYRSKSLFSVYASYARFQVTEGKNFFDGFGIDALKFGLRGYILQRLSADITLLVPMRTQNYSEIKKDAGMTIFMGSVNWDILPWKLKNLQSGPVPTYLSGFISTYQFTVSENNEVKGYWQYGLGLKLRVQLFANRPKLGIIYFEAEAGYYTQLKSYPYRTWTSGINLVYGLWNY